MGEIPPLPPSMQPELPERGKELIVQFNIKRENKTVVIETNLPEKCEIFINHNGVNYSQKYMINSGKIVIEDADDITQIIIDSGVFSSDEKIKSLLGKKCRNLAGTFVKYHPIQGNHVYYKAKI